MTVKDHPSYATEATDGGSPLNERADRLDALAASVPLARVVERRPVLRLAPDGTAAVAAERLVVSRRKLLAALGAVAGDDADLLRHAADRIAARLPSSLLAARGADEEPLGEIAPRLPVLLPLPLGALPGPAPRPGLVGVLPLAAAAAGPFGGAALAERRAALAALGWRLGVGGLDAAALRFVAPRSLAADLLLLRWSPDLARGNGALRGADGQALVLTGCDGPDAVRWGRNAGLALFSGPGAEAMAPAGASR